MNHPRVVIGMSGGVDSAVSAFLLKRRKFDVIGVHMINWDSVEEGTSNCPQTRDEADARKVCARLEIPFHTVNFVKEYWNEVFIKLLDNYRRGRTIVPDVQCNKSIKFHHLHDYVIKQFNADYIASGHYVQSSFGCFQEKRDENSKVKLLSAVDPLKDQTYFLCTLSQDQLKRAMFPVGNLMKTEVRRIAQKAGLNDVAKKPESMGICFVGKKKSFNDFVAQYIEDIPGQILNKNGTIVGEHPGIHHYTLGKRVPISNGSHLGLFVSHIDVENNIVDVCEGSHNPCLYATEFVVQSPVWIADSPLNDSSTSLRCRIQRSHPAVDCTLIPQGDKVTVIPKIPLRAVATGQMCAFYNNQECLGGGEVEKVTKTLDSSK